MADSAEQFDLSVDSDLLRYLSGTPFASLSATALTGGTGNYVFRIRLQSRYEGRETLVVKHAKPYLPSNKDFKFSTSRQVGFMHIAIRVSTMLMVSTDFRSWILAASRELNCRQ